MGLTITELRKYYSDEIKNWRCIERDSVFTLQISRNDRDFDDVLTTRTAEQKKYKKIESALADIKRVQTHAHVDFIFDRESSDDK